MGFHQQLSNSLIEEIYENIAIEEHDSVPIAFEANNYTHFPKLKRLKLQIKCFSYYTAVNRIITSEVEVFKIHIIPSSSFLFGLMSLNNGWSIGIINSNDTTDN